MNDRVFLKKFEVENFRGFNRRLVFDFTAGRYDFNPDVTVEGFVKNALVYGNNGVGKSALGFALFDIVAHLTDKRVDDLRNQVIPYCNLNNDSNPASFKYVLSWNCHEIVYEYKKSNLETLVWERLAVDGERIVEYDFVNRSSVFVREGLVGSLNTSLPDNKLSILKYIYRNTPTDTVPVVSALVKFCENMLWFRSLSRGNQFVGHDSAITKLTDMVQRNGTIDGLVAFLAKFGLSYNLGFEQENGEAKLYAYMKDGKKALFEAVASTGTMTLYLFYCWTISAFSDVSLLFIDEFDAFLHFEASTELVRRLNRDCPFQSILTTHNTSLLSNDLSRPDCSFLMFKTKDGDVAMRCLSRCSEREIRQVHNLEKMYRAGAFSCHE